MQDIREPGLFTVCLDSGPFGFGCCDNVRVSVAEIIRLYHSAVVNLHTVKDPVPVFCFAFGRKAVVPELSSGVLATVSLYELDPERIWVHRSRIDSLNESEHVAAH